MSTLTLINGLIRHSGAALVLSPKPGSSDPCCCDNCTYEFCFVNGNQILDNSWDVYVNDNLIGNYSGAPFTNICLDIEATFLIIPGNNTLKFTRQNCVNDDLFEFEVLKTCDEAVTVLYAGTSNLLDHPGGVIGNCTDNEFTRLFQL